jgi:hypothetical protein
VPSSAALSISAWAASISACSSSCCCCVEISSRFGPGSSDVGEPCRMWLGESGVLSYVSSSGASNAGSNWVVGDDDLPFWVVSACWWMLMGIIVDAYFARVCHVDRISVETFLDCCLLLVGIFDHGDILWTENNNTPG